MYGEKPILTTARFTLMCRDHEAATFVWNVPERRVTGRIDTIEAAYLPWGTQDHEGNTNRRLMALWIADRSIPSVRPNAIRRLRAVGIEDADMLLALSGGSSLSDQYWLRREGSSLTWDDVSFYTNDFDPRLGQYLTSQDSQSTARLADAIARDLDIAMSSPDSSLGGNLPKRWEIRGNQRVLVKRSLSAYGQEPMNEVLASSLCERLGVAHVPYDAETDGVTWESTCPCMTDDNTELVSAWHVVCGCNRRGDESRAAWYKRACANHGLDVSREVEQMLVVDYIICNWDRHWSNFGVLVNSETREWLRPAPLFDMGESLWCDRTPAQGLGGYVASREGAPRPFLHRLDDQLGRYCHDLSWLDSSALEGFGEEVTERLLRLKFVAVFKGRAEAIGEAVDKRIQRVLHTLSYLHR